MIDPVCSAREVWGHALRLAAWGLAVWLIAALMLWLGNW